MENAIRQNKDIISSINFAALFIAVILSFMVIVYSVESIAPGVHDAFHDFRHATGFACH